MVPTPINRGPRFVVINRNPNPPSVRDRLRRPGVLNVEGFSNPEHTVFPTLPKNLPRPGPVVEPSGVGLGETSISHVHKVGEFNLNQNPNHNLSHAINPKAWTCGGAQGRALGRDSPCPESGRLQVGLQ